MRHDHLISAKQLSRGDIETVLDRAAEIAAEETPSGRPEVELIVQSTDRRTLPNAVSHAIVRSSLGIADCTDANAIKHKRVVVR